MPCNFTFCKHTKSQGTGPVGIGSELCAGRAFSVSPPAGCGHRDPHPGRRCRAGSKWECT